MSAKFLSKIPLLIPLETASISAVGLQGTGATAYSSPAHLSIIGTRSNSGRSAFSLGVAPRTLSGKNPMLLPVHVGTGCCIKWSTADGIHGASPQSAGFVG